MHLLDGLSFVAWSLGDVRSWEPVQPELPQELGDPAPRPSLLALHSSGLYKAQTGALWALWREGPSPGRHRRKVLRQRGEGAGGRAAHSRRSGLLAAWTSPLPGTGGSESSRESVTSTGSPRLGREAVRSRVLLAVLPRYTALSFWAFSSPWEGRRHSEDGVALHCTGGEAEAPLRKKLGETRIQTRSAHIMSAPLSPTLQCSGAPRRTRALEVSQLRSQASLPSSPGSLPPPPQPLLPQGEWGWLLPALETSPSRHPATGCWPPPWGPYHSVFQLPRGSQPAGRDRWA